MRAPQRRPHQISMARGTLVGPASSHPTVIHCHRVRLMPQSGAFTIQESGRHARADVARPNARKASVQLKKSAKKRRQKGGKGI